MTTEWDVIVVGAGLAGLAAGATAARGGASTLVVDGHQAGGRARTTQRDGFTFNLGGHALYTGGHGIEVLRSLGVEPVGSPPPLERYRALQDGRQELLPTGPGTLVRTKLLGVRGKAQLAGILARLPRIDAAGLAGVSVSDWIRGHEVLPEVEAVLGALVRIGTYAADQDAFGADAAVTQMQAALRAGVLYLDGGWSQLVDGLARGVEVRSGVQVTGVAPAAGRVEVQLTDGPPLVARHVVVATGTPAAARGLLPADPGWGDLGDPVTAACLDLGVRRVPSPGYVLGIDVPIYGTTHAPPARLAPAGQAVVGVMRYGARDARTDRADLHAFLAEVGVADDDIVTERFLAHMVVAGAAPVARRGGLQGRPATTDTGVENVWVAGDWVGPDGLLADAALASGQAAALGALRRLEAGSAKVARVA